MKRTRNIILVLSGALATTALQSGCAPRANKPTSYDTAAAAAEFGGGDEQENDSYIPGVGYYHAPYHAWFPYRWNYYNPASGYYYGGNWHATPYPNTSMVNRSRPSSAAIVAAHTVLRGSRSSAVGLSGFSAGTGSKSSAPHVTTPSRPSGLSGHSVIHGGFGGSAHGSSS